MRLIFGKKFNEFIRMYVSIIVEDNTKLAQNMAI
jgi:hypothetical protein